jgi:hypothetical protein
MEHHRWCNIHNVYRYIDVTNHTQHTLCCRLLSDNYAIISPITQERECKKRVWTVR